MTAVGRAPSPDPAAAALLSAIPPEDPDAPIDVANARAGYDALGALGGGAEVPEGALDVADGAVAGVPVRWYRVAGAARPGPTVVFFHGGGFTIGGLGSHDGQCRLLAHLAGVTVLAVDYRLAPEHRFPAAFDDAAAVVEELLERGAEHGVDPQRTGVCGNSAGGGICAVTAQRFGGRLRFQALLYPTVDFSGEWPSYEENRTGFLLTMKTMHWFRQQVAPDEELWSDLRLSPLHGDLSGVAPAWILTCGFDPLRDEGAAFAERLAAAGVPVTHVHVDDQIHECVQLAGIIPKGRELLGDLAAWVREALA